MSKPAEKEEKEKGGGWVVSLLGAAPATEDLCAASLLWERVSICLSVKGCASPASRHRAVLFIHRGGGGTGNSQRELPGEKGEGRSPMFYRRK